jgi:rSAM/selenodomain-associated transferase 2
MEKNLTPGVRPPFSIILPVLNEEAAINGALERLRRLAPGGEAEILVVDGDPAGGTLQAIIGDDVKKIRSPRGRGRQMNEGAKSAGGVILLFLHADTLLPPDALSLVTAALGDEKAVGGAFDLAFSSERRAFKVIAAVASCRSRLTRVPFGDQAHFLRRDYFRQIGGYREIPLMEDVELMGRIRRRGDRIVFIDRPVRTSARRWEKEGLLRCTLRNWLLQFLYLLGVSPERLAKLYRDW